jgi:NADH-quinone oxidoreductase subunit J
MDTLIQVVFFAISALILGAAVMVVVVKNLIHAALWVTASFLGVAALYLMMEAEFLGVVQVLIYAGAISILILFAIMLTRHVTGEGVRQLYERWWMALLVAVLLFGAVLAPQLLNSEADQRWRDQTTAAQGQILPEGQTPVEVLSPVEGAPAPLTQRPIAGAKDIGVGFMREFLLPFEVASILLLVALIGAIVVAYEERGRRRRVLTLAEQVAMRRQPPTEPAGDVELALSPQGREGQST